MSLQDSLPLARPRLLRPVRQPPFGEFVALVAMMFATTALSIDAMLPALPKIAADLGLSSTNHAQLVISAFMLGLGLGQLVTGPVSDSAGRRRVIAAGILVYVVGAAMAYFAQSLTALLLARFLQGLGISAPRIVAVAMVRDLYQGRMMARVMSFVMTLFILVPAVAPFFGQTVIAFAGWRAIFVAFALFGTVALLWLLSRQPETLIPERRRPFSLRTILAAMAEVLGNPLIRIYILGVALGFASLFAFIASAQQVYEVVFGKVESFPAWFALQALLAGTAGPVNARFVMRLGMRRMATFAFLCQALASLAMALIWWSGLLADHHFAIYFLWSTSVFFMNGLLFGNLNALALEPVGHIAGLAASVVGAVSTLIAILIAVPVGLAFNGTPVPLILGVTCFACAGYALMLYARRHS